MVYLRMVVVVGCCLATKCADKEPSGLALWFTCSNKVAPFLAGMEVRSAEIARRREEREQRRKDQEMERVAQLQHEEEERREAERKAREALVAQRREERKVARQARLLSHK